MTKTAQLDVAQLSENDYLTVHTLLYVALNTVYGGKQSIPFPP